MKNVVIIGGGLAGLSAAVQLAQLDCRVTLIESRPRLGGRASSFEDSTTGELIDNCQHVVMGCCTNFRELLRLTSLEHVLQREPCLHFVEPPETASGRVPRIANVRASRLPAPCHLVFSFAGLPYLNWSQKRSLASGVLSLARTTLGGESQSFESWLHQHSQPTDVIERFWKVVLVSALSESLDRISVSAARKVIVEGFLAHRDAWEMWLPTMPLDVLYSQQIANWLTQKGVEIQLKSGVERLVESAGQVTAVVLRDGTQLPAHEVILAVPHTRVHALLPESLQHDPALLKIKQLESAPIASVHLWFDREITALPHAVIVGRLSQWMFRKPSRSSSAETIHGYQVVISAAREVAARPSREVIEEVVAELREIWTAARSAELKHARVVTEHAAVFSPTPNSDSLRPPQRTSIPNLHLAGDWTQTGWPATMEGAVRSGFQAADLVRQRLGQTPLGLPPDLPTARLTRWLLRS